MSSTNELKDGILTISGGFIIQLVSSFNKEIFPSILAPSM